ncbi:hypothetical protein [Tsukamurella paurometabola]|uniref:Lipoprotein n=1 Tax=Tsukamurella paurometabola TaxID=2061 RepID=A0ABS5N7D6_TSUPA|nr:hypothetical protein [Tsukamurella paurometabola]MBS4100134.1 hypothetical protein [Tsukamurella paurometabola]
MLGAGVLAGCSGTHEPVFGVDGVERDEASCAVPSPPWTVLASYGNFGYGTSVVQWTGGVRGQDVRDAFRDSDGAADIDPPTDDQVERVRDAVNSAVLATFPARSSEVSVRTGAGERKVAYELRCRYRVAMHRAGQRFTLDVEGGSGRWEVMPAAVGQGE